MYLGLIAKSMRIRGKGSRCRMRTGMWRMQENVSKIRHQKWKPRRAKSMQKIKSNNFFEPLSSGSSKAHAQTSNVDRNHLAHMKQEMQASPSIFSAGISHHSILRPRFQVVCVCRNPNDQVHLLTLNELQCLRWIPLVHQHHLFT